MKTIFKVGMNVWDKTISPNKGKVIEAFTDTKFDFPIKVEFEDGLKVQYTNDGCFVKSKGAICTLSTTDYSVQMKGFEKKAPAPTYEKALEWLEKNSKDRVIYADKAYINEEYERAFEALRKLTILRDFYNEGWKPDWNKCSTKYCIEQEGLDISAINQIFNSRVMCFETGEIRDNFLEDQRELLEIAKPLL